ncbi:hypothetical protein BN1051_00053 [Arthrobacter saudimassiliensis]|uniref:Uncharacterized protein n=1 Tax=Arthrobacter saudimassiliensis TaxID=1461584 RepID=A0A078MPA2_9MICC|nr:hypothetical protein BN1051_00053 [Arthrobacter saudimassiliensis]
MPADGGAASDPDELARWDAVLTQLEDNLEASLDGSTLAEQAEAVARGWQPPLDLGPLPPELAARAVRLAQAQQRALKHLRREARVVRKQAELLRTAAPTQRAVYLDVAG